LEKEQIDVSDASDVQLWFCRLFLLDDLTHIILVRVKQMLARCSSSKPLLNAIHRVILKFLKLHSTIQRLRFASRFADTALRKFPTLFEVKRTCSQWKLLSADRPLVNAKILKFQKYFETPTLSCQRFFALCYHIAVKLLFHSQLIIVLAVNESFSVRMVIPWRNFWLHRFHVVFETVAESSVKELLQ